MTTPAFRKRLNSLPFCIPGFNSTEEENRQTIHNFRKRSWQILRKKIDDEVADNVFLLKLRERYYYSERRNNVLIGISSTQHNY